MAINKDADSLASSAVCKRGKARWSRIRARKLKTDEFSSRNGGKCTEHEALVPRDSTIGHYRRTRDPQVEPCTLDRELNERSEED